MACKCGGNRFVARQVCRHDIVVDDSNMYMEQCGSNGKDIYDAETPYGPYTCLQCETVWDNLPHYKVKRMKTLEMQLNFTDHTWDTLVMCVPETEFKAIEDAAGGDIYKEAALTKERLVQLAYKLLDPESNVASIDIYHIPDEWEDSIVRGDDACIL